MTTTTFPTDTEIDAMTLASRLLGQLHRSLDVKNDVLIACTDCDAKWFCDVDATGRLKLTEAQEGNHSCEAEVLRAISTAGLYSELGRRRLAKRKTVTRAGGRPRKDGTPPRKTPVDTLESARQALVEFGKLERKQCLAYEFVALKLGCTPDVASVLVIELNKGAN